MIDLPNYVRTLSLLGGEEEGEGQQDGEAGEGDGTETMNHGVVFGLVMVRMRIWKKEEDTPVPPCLARLN
jgi:hypothetical protein